jgi:hypothetical protein
MVSGLMKYAVAHMRRWAEIGGWCPIVGKGLLRQCRWFASRFLHDEWVGRATTSVTDWKILFNRGQQLKVSAVVEEHYVSYCELCPVYAIRVVYSSVPPHVVKSIYHEYRVHSCKVIRILSRILYNFHHCISHQPKINLQNSYRASLSVYITERA